MEGGSAYGGQSARRQSAVATNPVATPLRRGVIPAKQAGPPLAEKSPRFARPNSFYNEHTQAQKTICASARSSG